MAKQVTSTLRKTKAIIRKTALKRPKKVATKKVAAKAASGKATIKLATPVVDLYCLGGHHA